MLYKCVVVVIVLITTGLCNAFAQAQDISQQNVMEQKSTEQDTSSQNQAESGENMALQSSPSQDILNDIHFFQFFHKDGTIDPNPYIDAGLGYYDYDRASSYTMGVQGGMSILSRLQLDGEINFVNWDPDYDQNETGISDLLVSARYLVLDSGDATFAQPYTAGLQVTAGGYICLPVGNEEIEQGNLSLGAFSAARYPLNFGLVLAANVGLDYIETTNWSSTSDDYEISLSLGAGAIYPFNEELSIIGEIYKKTEIDYLLASVGVDYQLNFGGHLRAAVGEGFSDTVYGIGATDFMLTTRFMYPF
jgi:hypothetical protein